MQVMAEPAVVLMNGGGVRSLVAGALVRAELPTARLTVLHVVDGRASSGARREHVRRQAEAWEAKLVEVVARQLYGDRPGADGLPRGVLVWPRLLLEGVAQACGLKSERLVWPVGVNLEVTQTIRAGEQAVLCETLWAAELGEIGGEAVGDTGGSEEAVGTVGPCVIDMPLLEMSDAQVVDLGGRLKVDWGLAWWCDGAGAEVSARRGGKVRAGGGVACGACGGCMRWQSLLDRQIASERGGESPRLAKRGARSVSPG